MKCVQLFIFAIRTLAQYLAQRDKPMDEKEILEIFSQVAQAIKHIHQHNILHR